MSLAFALVAFTVLTFLLVHRILVAYEQQNNQTRKRQPWQQDLASAGSTKKAG